MTTKLAENIQTGINSDQPTKVIEILTGILADQHVLYIKLRNFHWNLKGPRFNTLHKFFEDQYGELEGAIDETAERIRMIGGVAPGSMAEFIDHSSLKEVAGDLMSGDDCIRVLKHDHESVIRGLRESIPICENVKDPGTADFLTGLLRAHEMTAWMLRSFHEK